MEKTSIFYINLAHRTDRRDHIEKELEKVSEIKKERIEAIYNPSNCLYGCNLSHILALQTFLADESLDICIVFEDDFTFYDPEPMKRLNELFTGGLDWDIVSLAYNPNGGIIEPCNVHGFKKVIRIGTASGYIVRREFAKKLLANFQEAKVLMEKRRCHESAHDVHWQVLQPISKWFAFEPRLGFQCESHSDIEGKVVNYKC